jgi:hypothetical protein
MLFLERKMDWNGHVKELVSGSIPQILSPKWVCVDDGVVGS